MRVVMVVIVVVIIVVDIYWSNGLRYHTHSVPHALDHSTPTRH